MKKYKIGYTQGTYDLFHVGHLNLLENAKKQCEHLIVGINSDELVFEYKNKKVNITAKDRARIVGALKVVDEVYVVNTLDKVEALKKFGFDAIFIGDDWKGNPRWTETERLMRKNGTDLVYLPHTNGISTTQIESNLKNKNNVKTNNRKEFDGDER